MIQCWQRNRFEFESKKSALNPCFEHVMSEGELLLMSEIEIGLCVRAMALGLSCSSTEHSSHSLKPENNIILFYLNL